MDSTASGLWCCRNGLLSATGPRAVRNHLWNEYSLRGLTPLMLTRESLAACSSQGCCLGSRATLVAVYSRARSPFIACCVPHDTMRAHDGHRTRQPRSGAFGLSSSCPHLGSSLFDLVRLHPGAAVPRASVPSGHRADCWTRASGNSANSRG